MKKNFFGKEAGVVLFLTVVSLFFTPLFCFAAEITSEIRIFNPANFVLEQHFTVSFSKFDEAPSLAIIDLGGDGLSEILIGAPAGKKPEIKIYREDGSLVNSFTVYDEKFLGGVNVGAGDLDGDGKDEIITSPASIAAAEIKVFDGYGKQKNSGGFFAFDKNIKNGASVTAGDLDGDGKGEIIVGSGLNQEAEIKIFKNTGGFVSGFRVEGIKKWSGVNAAVGDVNGDGEAEIVVTPGWGSSPEVRIFSKDGQLAKSFLAYAKNFRGGVNVTLGDTDNDGEQEIVLGAGFTGGPHVRIFDGDGAFEDQFFPFSQNLRSGVLVGVGKFSADDSKLIAMPNKTGPGGKSDLYKYIEVDISEQKLKFYENGFLLGEHLVSTGTYKTPTPLGEFKVLSKSETAYSNAYSLYMPHFMLFTKSGAGIHGLPYWKNGSKFVYEGVNHLGKRVSHGCIRLALDVAGKIFEWADVSTPVIVHQ